MFYACIPAYLSTMLMFFYLIARNRNDLKRPAIIQSILTTLAIIVATLGLLSPASEWNYTIWILVGLVLCLIGDISNIDVKKDRNLFVAMPVYAAAFLIFATAFTRIHGFLLEDWFLGAVFLVIYGLIIRLYWKGLGKYRIAVMLFGLVMLFMVTKAVSALLGDTLSITPAIMVSLGAILVLLGVFEYGVNRFHKPVKFVYGPVCYAGGQLLIALSCSYVAL
ncbi:MAG: hypothetical protein JW704_05035 [Anaerolineaceae bacterium]|nr:hypothetical protein [Anaerolineaceae bacterium]MBN2676660.1 hypothetical protein [Anaerolineaceae bacterium]